MTVGTAPQVPELATPTPWSPSVVSRAVRLGSVGAMVCAGAAGAVAYAPTARLGPALLVTAGLLGLPHGAVDHLALGWSSGRLGPARRGIVLGYAVAAAGAVLASLAFPALAVLALLVLSAAHFAEGEHAFDRGLRWPAAAAIGVGVVAVPLLIRPADVAAVLATLSPALPAALTAARAPVLALTVVLALWAAVGSVRARDLRSLGELTVLAAAALAAPPLVFFAVYFGGWHAPRHVVRLLTLEPIGSTGERVRRLARGAAVPTLAAASGLVGLALLLGRLPGAVLLALLALTVPHTAVVAWIGHRFRRDAQAVGMLAACPDPCR